MKVSQEHYSMIVLCMYAGLHSIVGIICVFKSNKTCLGNIQLWIQNDVFLPRSHFSGVSGDRNHK